MAETKHAEAAPEAEIELKLLTDRRTARRVWSHAFVKPQLQSPPRTRHIQTIYYDTVGFDLKQQKCAFRIRHVGNQFEQHIKTAGSAKSGTFHRKEWQAPLSSQEPDFNAWTGKPAAMLAPYKDFIKPIFESDMERTDALLCGDDYQIEIAVDIGVIRSFTPDGKPDEETPLVEIELELKEGNPLHLNRLACELSKTLPLRLGWQSKAQRGYELATHATPPFAKPGKLKIPKASSHAQAMAMVLGDAMNHYLSNIPNLATEGAAEAVHQTRVACRRIRAALTLAKPYFHEGECSDLQLAFKELANTLSPVRDLDVLIEETIPQVIFAAETPLAIRLTLENTILALKKRRISLLKNAYRRLQSPETTRTLLLLALRTCEMAQSTDHKNVDASAEALIAKRYKPLRKRNKILQDQDPVACHDLRIATKKLRYAIEFCAALYNDKKMYAYAQKLSGLQDTLGELNDIDNIPSLIRQHAPKTVETQIAMGIVCGWHIHRTRNHLDVALQISESLKSPSFFNKDIDSGKSIPKKDKIKG